ncbi:MAG TPA: SPOR domain-containing protein, partial [Hansschlegelia sp.]
MADRYQDRPFSDNPYRHGSDQPARSEGDPLAELARLIGQSDPLAGMGRANQPISPNDTAHEAYDNYEPLMEADDDPPAGPPPWMQRVARQEAAPSSFPEHDYLGHDDQDMDGSDQDYPDYPSSVHPLQRYAAAHPATEPEYHEAPPFADEHQPLDPSRYDDALFGQPDPGTQAAQHDPAYFDEPYGYDDGYREEAANPVRKRRGGLATVVVVLALAVLGTGAAFAYRTYVGS